MPIDEAVKKTWQKMQSDFDYPVDALGRPIDPNDEETLAVWREEGIDSFMQP